MIGLSGVRRKENVAGLSPYMGSVITFSNRREYEAKQKEFFIEKYTADIVAKRDKILAQTDKTPEELNVEVEEFNSKQINEQQLDELAQSFAVHQRNKENKHYKKYLQGFTEFTYKGKKYPVMTEELINKTKEIKEIEDVRAKEGVNIERAEATAETGVTA